MITVSLVGDREMIARLTSMSPRIRRSLRAAIERESIYEVGYVKGQKLSGQVLNRRTGTLSRSINAKTTETATGIYASIGTNVIYGRIHELGGLIHRTSSRGKEFTITMPQRSFLASTLRDNADRIKKAMREAVETAVYA